MSEKWCSCNPLREAQAKAAKWDALMERMGGVDGLVRLMDDDCDACAAISACNGFSGTCQRTRAAWLLWGAE